MRGSARIARSVSIPFMPGISTSSVTASKRSARSRASASRPEWTRTVSTPSAASFSAISAAIFGSSSTTSTRRPAIVDVGTRPASTDARGRRQ